MEKGRIETKIHIKARQTQILHKVHNWDKIWLTLSSDSPVKIRTFLRGYTSDKHKLGCSQLQTN